MARRNVEAVAMRVGRALVIGLVVTSPAQAQTPAPVRAAAQGTASRTPWGDPDLQGIWDHRLTTPLERPAKFETREFLTEEEVQAIEKAAADAAANVLGRGRDVRAERGTETDVEGAYNNVFSTGGGGRYTPSRRTSLIIDPPNGRRPPITEEGKRLLALANREFIPGPDGDIPNPEFRGTRRGRQGVAAGRPGQGGPLGQAGRVGQAGQVGQVRQAGQGGRGSGGVPYIVDIGRPNDNPEDRNDLERCTGVSLPCAGGLCSFSRLVQSPSEITIYYEMGHSGGAYRTIPITTRPHLPPHITQWFGDSIARWDGDTLVVDTTNFTDKTSYGGISDEKLHMIERFRRLNDSDLQYQLTIDKPSLYTAPFTIEYIYRRADEQANKIYESQCYEGNYALTAMLAGERALEREASEAAKKRRGLTKPRTAKRPSARRTAAKPRKAKPAATRRSREPGAG